MLGASLFYGDSVITPAISVLGAVEGLEAVTPAFKPFVLPISIGRPSSGCSRCSASAPAPSASCSARSSRSGSSCSPSPGVVADRPQPAILAALDPLQAVAFLQARGWHLFVVMGSIVLALTGAEALYADMGHFGKRPIRIAWTGLVLPSLALNYMGQGALLMRDPAALENPFFRLFPAAC